MLSASILSVGLRGEGLQGWRDGSDVLRKCTPLPVGMGDLPAPEGISSRERRRLSPIISLALAVAEEAMSGSGLDARDVASVFSWPHGDTSIIQTILESLCTEDRCVSPTAFHNSVHNVAAGYWSIATGSQTPCTSISAGLDTFVAALVKSLVQIRAERCTVLLTVTDAPFPEPINSAYPIQGAYAAALMLAPIDVQDCIARITVGHEKGASERYTLPRHDDLRECWDTNAAVRAIPVLEKLAQAEEGSVILPCAASGTMIARLHDFHTAGT